MCAARVLLAVLLLLVQVSESADTLADDSGSAAINGLVSWLEEGGAELSAVKVGSGVGGERGVRAARDFAPGDTILRGNSACYCMHMKAPMPVPQSTLDRRQMSVRHPNWL